MIKDSSAANSIGDLTEDTYEIIDRDLMDMKRRLKLIRTKAEADAMAVEIGRARQRAIAVARAEGGLVFARLMRPFDGPVHGENITIMRRRRRW